MGTQTETFERAFLDSDRPMLSYGSPYQDACRKHVDETFKASRVYIICSRTLAKTTTALADLQEVLAHKVVGLRVGMSAPTLVQECLEVINDVRRTGADIVVTIGGGSLTDAGKIVIYVHLHPKRALFGPLGLTAFRHWQMMWRPKNNCWDFLTL